MNIMVIVLHKTKTSLYPLLNKQMEKSIVIHIYPYPYTRILPPLKECTKTYKKTTWFYLKSILSGRNQIRHLCRILDTADYSGRKQVCGGQGREGDRLKRSTRTFLVTVKTLSTLIIVLPSVGASRVMS